MSNKRNRPTQSQCPFPIGSRIHPVARFEQHDYLQGETYIVSEIDPNDSTLRARDACGSIGSWIRWVDCRVATDIGWDWLKGQLPAETLELLSAFNGLEQLTLRHEISIALIAGMPALKQSILGCIEQLETTQNQS